MRRRALAEEAPEAIQEEVFSLIESASPPPPSRRPSLSTVDHAHIVRLTHVGVLQTDTETAGLEQEPETFEPEFSFETQFYCGLDGDIASGGLFVPTYRMLPVGTRLVLTLQLAEAGSHDVRGTVRWLRLPPTLSNPDGERPGMGVAFAAASDEVLAAIRSYCERHPPLYVEV